MSNDGYQLADANDYDVALAFIERGRGLNSDKPLLLRLDGIWFKPQDFDRLNKDIRESYHAAAGVVFQSEFDKQMIEKWWGPAPICRVIHNGISLEQREPLDLTRIKKDYDKVFVCSANWHKQKRLADNIRMFKHCQTFHPKSCLIVLGNNPDAIVADPSIFYAGSKSHDVCLELYKAADWFIHLAWLDHCPNVVVEALSQGLPVICTDSGGTKEIVRNNGFILKEDPYDFELTDYDNPPRVDVTQLTTLENRFEVNASYLDITSVAKRYEELFEELVK